MAEQARLMNGVVRFSKLLVPALSDVDDAKIALLATRILVNGHLPEIEVAPLSQDFEITASTVYAIVSGTDDWHAVQLLVSQGKLPEDPGIDVRVWLSDEQWRQAGGKALAAMVGHGIARRPSGKRTVMIVDDDEDICRLTADALGEAGLRVLEAHGAADAIGVVERHPEIDLVVTDIVMPEINGLKLADMIKVKRPSLRVLYTTGYADIEDMRPGTRLSDVIWKPYRPKDFIAAVLRALPDVSARL